jgi:biopolymer transport protein ExbB
MDIYSTIVRFFQSGGVFMYPIVVVLVLGLAISLERYVYLTQAKVRNRMVWNQLMPLLMNGKYQQAVTTAQKSKTAMSRILTYGLARAKNATHRDDVETAMEEGLMEAVPRFEKRTHYVDMLSASISVAMNTTAFGLMVAIPLLLVYAVLQTKTTELVDSLEMASVKFLNVISEKVASKEAV